MMFGKGTNYFSRLSGHEYKNMLRHTLNTTFCVFIGRLVVCAGVYFYREMAPHAPFWTHDAIVYCHS